MTNAKTWALRLLAALTITFLLILAKGCWKRFEIKTVNQDSIQRVLNDTLQLDQRRIPEDGDSETVLNNGISRWRWHDGRIIAIKPNRTWHWLILNDSMWYEAKYWRDSL